MDTTEQDEQKQMDSLTQYAYDCGHLAARLEAWNADTDKLLAEVKKGTQRLVENYTNERVGHQKKLCANCPYGNDAVIRDRCLDCMETILENHRNDERAEQAYAGFLGSREKEDK